MGQPFFHLPWFFPKCVAIVDTCVNTGHMHTCFKAEAVQAVRRAPGGAGLTPTQRGQGLLSRNEAGGCAK